MAEPNNVKSTFDSMRLGPPAPGFFPFTEIKQNVERYWGDVPERRFVITFWQADRLIAQSPNNELALRVTNIDQPAQVDATWISFNAADPEGEASQNTGNSNWITRLIDFLEGLLPSTPPENPVYYVLGPALYPVSGNNHFKQFTPHAEMTIVARLAKTADGKQFVYFNVCQLDLKGDETGGGGGATSGAKIPSGDG